MQHSSSALSPSQADLLSTLLESFAREFAENEGVPDLVVFSPGRVNIIGEHLDYSGYDVLPMAINRFSTCAVRRLSCCSGSSSGPAAAATENTAFATAAPATVPAVAAAARTAAQAASAAVGAATAASGASSGGEAAATLEHQEGTAAADAHAGQKKADTCAGFCRRPAATAAPYFLRVAHTHYHKYGSVTLQSPQQVLMALLQLERETQGESAAAGTETRKKLNSAPDGTCNGSEASSISQEGGGSESGESEHQSLVAGSYEQRVDQQQPQHPAQQKQQPQKKLEWHMYVYAALLGVLEYYHGGIAAVGQMLQHASTWGEELQQKFLQGDLPAIQLLVGGDLPMAAGLASSSSLVVGVVVAMAAALSIPLSRREVAAISTEAERYVKTAGGGMDQAVIALSPQEGAASAPGALRVTFEPELLTHAVALPAGLCFAVCHTTAESPKAGPLALTRFNKRVLECYLAALVLTKMATPAILTTVDPESLRCWTLRRTQEASLCLPSLHECAAAAAEKLHAAPYTKEEIQAVLGSSLLLRCMRRGFQRSCLVDAWEANDHFFLRQRAQHVYSEAARVHDFVGACTAASHKPRSETLRELGALMRASHRSCSDLFDCSCAEANSLVSLSASHPGVVGARMTGAGWGGCIIALLEGQEYGPNFLQQLNERFYDLPAKTLPAEAAAGGTVAGPQQQSASRAAVAPPAAGAETAAPVGGSVPAKAAAAARPDAEAHVAAEKAAPAARTEVGTLQSAREKATAAAENLLFLVKPAGGVMVYAVKGRRGDSLTGPADTKITSAGSSNGKPSGEEDSCSIKSVTDGSHNTADTLHKSSSRTQSTAGSKSSSSSSSSTKIDSNSSRGTTDSNNSMIADSSNPVAESGSSGTGYSNSSRSNSCTTGSRGMNTACAHASSSADNTRNSTGAGENSYSSRRSKCSREEKEEEREEDRGQWITIGKNRCYWLQAVAFVGSSSSSKRLKAEQQ